MHCAHEHRSVAGRAACPCEGGLWYGCVLGASRLEPPASLDCVFSGGGGLGLPGSLAMVLLPGQDWTDLPASMSFQGIHRAEVADTTGPPGPLKWAQESWL